MANAKKADRSEEMGLGKKKKSKVFEVPRSTLKNKIKQMQIKRSITHSVGNQCCPTVPKKNLSVTVR